MDAMRTRITKEAELVRKVQSMAEAAKRDVGTMEARIEKALSVRVALDKLRNEVTDIEMNVRADGEKVKENNEMIETNMTMLEGKVQGCIQTFNTEMMKVEDVRKTVAISNNQIGDFKDSITKRVDKQIENYRLHVAKLEGPQKEMHLEFNRMKEKTQELVEECNERQIQQDVTDQRLQLALNSIKELQQTRLEKD